MSYLQLYAAIDVVSLRLIEKSRTMIIKEITYPKPQNLCSLKTLKCSSSWILTCACLWICQLKSMDVIRKNGEAENRVFLCLLHILASLFVYRSAQYCARVIYGEIISLDGLAMATTLIKEIIRRRVTDRKSVLRVINWSD